MRTKLIMLIVLPLFISRCASHITDEYNDFSNIYLTTLDSVYFDCRGEISFEYSQDYHKSIPEQYFTLSTKQLCLIKPSETSIHDQVYSAFKKGERDVNKIIDNIKLQKIVVPYSNCAALKEDYQSFYKLFIQSIPTSKKKNSTIDKYGNKITTIILHPSIFKFTLNDGVYGGPEYTAIIKNEQHPLVKWAFGVDESYKQCSNK